MASVTEIQTILQYLDPQLQLPLLAVAEKAGMDVAEQIKQAKAAVVAPTKEEIATAFAAELKKAGPLIATYFNVEGDVFTFNKPVESEDIKAPTANQLSAVANLAKLAYISGNFTNACAIFALLVLDELHAEPTHYWGYLACAIRAEDWDLAAKVIASIEANLEDKSTLPRVWLWHASLFVAFFGGKHRIITEVIFQVEKQKDYSTRNNESLYYNRDVLEMTAPHYWRYLVASSFLAADGRTSIMNVCKFLRTLGAVPQDPIVRVGYATWMEHNAVAALDLLAEVASIVKKDVFLAPVADTLLDAIYKQVFDSYILSHKKVNLNLVARYTQQKVEDAEAWIVKLLEDKNYIKARTDSTKQEIEIVAVRGDAYSRVLRDVSKGAHKGGFKGQGYKYRK